MIFERVVELPVSQSDAFAYHARPHDKDSGALARLLPPWRRIKITKSSPDIMPGSRVELVMRNFGIPVRWIAEHRTYLPPSEFSDVQVSGPFKSWNHSHRFESIAAVNPRCRLIDRVDYELPWGRAGKLLGNDYVESQLKSMFAFRHRRTIEDLDFSNSLKTIGCTGVKTIAVSGSHGMIGSSIVAMLVAMGHRVIRIERPSDKKHALCDQRTVVQSTSWKPDCGLEKPQDLNGIDAVIHLAGKNLASGRWTQAMKDELRRSRVYGTKILAAQLASLDQPPRAFVTASGLGYYGPNGPAVERDFRDVERLSIESDPPGDDFLSKLADDWEKGCEPLKSTGVRCCSARFAMVLDPQQGALGTMLTLFRLGLGSPLGSGKQRWSWISREDAASCLVWLALNHSLEGPYNAVAQTLTNLEFTKTLAASVHRFRFVSIPAPILRLALGEMADALVLASNAASNLKLIKSGYVFRNPELCNALRHMLGEEI